MRPLWWGRRFLTGNYIRAASEFGPWSHGGRLLRGVLRGEGVRGAAWEPAVSVKGIEPRRASWQQPLLRCSWLPCAADAVGSMIALADLYGGIVEPEEAAGEPLRFEDEAAERAFRRRHLDAPDERGYPCRQMESMAILSR